MRGKSGGRGKTAGGGALVGVLVVVALGTTVAGCSAGGHSAATLPRATCGSASTHGLSSGTQVLSADNGSLTCFAAAARHCASASIAITEMGTDTGTNYVFAIGRAGAACRATELSQSYSVNFGGSTGAIDSVPCRLAAVTSVGVMLSCGGQDVLVPARVTA